MIFHLSTLIVLLAGFLTTAHGEDPLGRSVDDEERLSEDIVADLEEPVLDLNRASAVELASLSALSYSDAEKIVAFRGSRGPFRNPHDLFSVEGIPESVVEAIIPRVTAGTRYPVVLNSRARFIRRSASTRGESILIGSGLHSRTSYSIGELATVSFTTDKDPGEGSPLEFTAGFVEVRSEDSGWRLILGDFRPGFAQGLVFSRWGRVYMGMDQVIRVSSRRVGYLSTDENGALRGAYLSGLKNGWRISGFGSSSRYDATRDTSGLVNRLSESGRHVTPGEKRGVDALHEAAWGLRVERGRRGGVGMGTTVLNARFNPPFNGKGRAQNPLGSATIIGVDGHLSFEGFQVGGEAAQVVSGTQAWVVGAIYKRRGMKLGIQARDYDGGFRSIHGAGTSTFGDTQNERGFVSGVRLKAPGIKTFDLMFDRAWRPNPTERFPAGSRRSTLTFRVEQIPLRGWLTEWKVRGKWDKRWKGKRIGLMNHRGINLRINLTKKFRSNFRVKTRGEIVRARVGSEQASGMAFFGDVGFRWHALKARGRLTYFEAPSYETRIFEWEDSPTGLMGTRTLTGRGLKGYILLSKPFGGSRATIRLWRWHAFDGREPKTEIVAQWDCSLKGF